jgi:hypothetical protein
MDWLVLSEDRISKAARKVGICNVEVNDVLVTIEDPDVQGDITQWRGPMRGWKKGCPSALRCFLN